MMVTKRNESPTADIAPDGDVILVVGAGMKISIAILNQPRVALQ
jgi:hypothetical protein